VPADALLTLAAWSERMHIYTVYPSNTQIFYFFLPSLKVRTEPEAIACVYKGNDVAGVGVVDDENYEDGLQARMPGEVTEEKTPRKKNERKK
jgi:hypothetical protein